MPLNFAPIDTEHTIKKVGGPSDVRSHLSDIGFVPGGTVRIISSVGDNLIVDVKGSRVALSGELAKRIMV
ncbi:MAG: ferrous iron transport protein A [Oscillospiraceae bacterium]|nr:ferrous iron transport protein A [Oscillospiraceae bacterium]